MTLQPHKRSDTQPDMIQHRAQPTALGAFNQTLLFKGAMIHLNAPRAFGLRFPFRFAHLLDARRPIFRRAVCSANTEYFDFSKPFEPHHCSIAAAQSGFGDRLQTASVDVDLPVRLQARQKMPRERRTNLRFSTDPYPLSKQTSSGLNPRSEASSSISAKWSFFVLPSRSLSNTR